MFVDTAKVFVKGGDGGDGIVSYRRELYVPNGGPAGGDGGDGGDVIFRVDEGLRTLMDFRYQRHYKAPKGERGQTKTRHGANAEDMIVRVPPGTLLVDDDTKEVIADMTRHGQEIVIAKGGKGGRGNARFATANNPAPDIAEKGEEGQERYVLLELKVMADVGLVGFPSVGKSTLLSMVSAAQPKIGAYHFTTLTPNLGVVDVEDGLSFVMADLPGLIEGAHTGIGLGHEFLRHVERTRIIVHVVDMSGSEGRDPYDDWLKINDELKLYNAKLERRPQLVVANKMDIPEAAEHLEEFKRKLEENHGITEVIPISAASRQGVRELIFRIAGLLAAVPEEPLEEEDENPVQERVVYTFAKQKDPKDFAIHQDEDGVFVVESENIEKMMRRLNFASDDTVLRFARTLRKMGVDQALRDRGAKDGDTVRINEFEFEFSEKG
ncbi:GTPase ObgE [Paenibacillus sp. YN15]|uniref:GTPase ObgE n=1 Tax=Paenibacillus sp. YN15 TaxID=1742774 RepID=UPI000DCB2162|nr:GTPase ObgE [Paenibacillus sp. YN15]RAV04029.1 GTPase ObgE [Paenibacillus sp. YN15]